MGSISFRKYIRWLPDEASEPTSTLVVTSPQRCFVDIRILRLAGTENSIEYEEPGTLSLDRLDWAIAGTSSSVTRNDSMGRQITHSQWCHWIDSRTPEADGIVDEGDMFFETDHLTLEKGTMVNPATGLETGYEELWLDVDPIATTTSSVQSLVLQLQKDSNGARGMVVRLGHYCQGFLRLGDEIGGERWEWKKENGWRQTLKFGADLELPCQKVLGEDSMLLEGDTIQARDQIWTVIETSEG